MKKVIIVLTVLLVLLAAATVGMLQYRNAHFFFGETAYPRDAELLDLRGQELSFEDYLTLRAELPECEILWDVPLHGGRYSSDIREMTLTVLDREMMETICTYFPALKRIDASACNDYDLLEELSAKLSGCEITYQVDLGGLKIMPEETEITLEPDFVDYDVLMENLRYVPGLESICFQEIILSPEQVAALTEEYPHLQVTYTVTVLGTEYDNTVTALDLSAMTPEQVEEACQGLSRMQNLETVELMDAEGVSALSMEDVKALQTAAPQAEFHYTFKLFKQTISTTDESIVFINNQRIRDENEAEIRLALDIMENCKRFELNNCRLSNAVAAQLREDYRGKTDVVWRVFFGEYSSCLTDKDTIIVVYGLTDDNSKALQYCEHVKFMDIGHNEVLDAVPFVANMPELEAIIVSGAPITDLSPFANSKKLEFLEIAYCAYVTDLSPLVGCESLKMLNISYTGITDLSPLDDLDIEVLCCVQTDIPEEELERFRELHPDCWITSEGEAPYDVGWRRDENGENTAYYAKLREIFHYDHPGNTYW